MQMPLQRNFGYVNDLSLISLTRDLIDLVKTIVRHTGLSSNLSPASHVPGDPFLKHENATEEVAASGQLSCGIALHDKIVAATL